MSLQLWYRPITHDHWAAFQRAAPRVKVLPLAEEGDILRNIYADQVDSTILLPWKLIWSLLVIVSFIEVPTIYGYIIYSL